MTNSLRSELDRIVFEHFDPSLMGRAQCVDELMAAVEAHYNKAAMASVTPAGPKVMADFAREPQVQMVISVDPAGPGISIAEVLHEEGRRAGRRSGW